MKLNALLAIQDGVNPGGLIVLGIILLLVIAVAILLPVPGIVALVVSWLHKKSNRATSNPKDSQIP